MERHKFAVVRDGVGNKYFNVLHDTQEDAEKEAERLARKEGARFLLLKLIGYFEPDVRPVKKEVWG